VSAIVDHVWQSTWFAFAAWIFARCLRKDLAQVRCCIWLAASIKFLFPFALLSWIGGQFIVAIDDRTMLLPIVKHVASPLTSAAAAISQVSARSQWLLLAIWAPICGLLLQHLLVGWLASRALLRSSIPCNIPAPIEVRSSRHVPAPCVIGVLNPVLLLPQRLLSDLTQTQLSAVFAHEMAHVRRNDNLLAYLHSFVQALFWFHPLIWLIGAQLGKEREHACDEAAIELGHEPLDYAATLLQVCKQCVPPDRLGVAYATSGNLPERIRVIMAAQFKGKGSRLSKCVLIAALLGCVALPFAAGMNVVVTSDLSMRPGTRSIRVSDAAGPSLLVMNERYVYGRNVSLRELIGRACAVSTGDVSGEIRELDYPRYDVEIRSSAKSGSDQRQLVADLLEQRFNVQLKFFRPSRG
jgi:bla regulator protein BlaR1